MNMWAVSALPVYSVDRAMRRGKAAKKSKSSDGPDASKQTSFSSPNDIPSGPNQLLSHNIADLLEPAVDGPPSPESIRALSKQVKRSSARDKPHSHQATSSGSSSLRSLASGDRPFWENPLEGIALSRKSSGRSTTSSMPSRERPESVQIFGKTIFNRRGKLRRESSAQSSSGSSLYSAENPSEAMLPPTSVPAKESSIPGAFFGRRRATMKSEPGDSAVAQRKFQISNPYNFQHVTHTQREQLLNPQQTNRMALASEFSQLRASQAPTAGALRGIHAEDLHFADFSSEALPLVDEYHQSGAQVEPHTRIFLNRPPSLMQKQMSPPRRLIKHTRSQEQLRVPPPRPPRSPIEPDYHPLAPPVPPPRISSRVSIRYDGHDPLTSTDFERPQTSGGFRHPRPLAFAQDTDTAVPPATSHGFSPSSNLDVVPEYQLARVATPPDDANWPLPCSPTTTYEAALPGVPEEEENAFVTRHNRASLVSNRSSLRVSQSVPLLRQLSLSQSPESRRPPSGASETLGHFDLLVAQRALRAALIEGNGSEIVTRESWEDDIDYCYEHAAEADCDYAWDRPSFDVSREGEAVPPVGVTCQQDHGVESSPAMLAPGQFDVPALSPISQISTTTAQEAITPTALALPKTSNFSLPRTEASSSQRFLHVRKPSDASSFKESHGFNLSPSLLIPCDYRQQMLALGPDDIADRIDYPYRESYDEEPTLTMNTSQLLIHPRASASTIGSTMTDQSTSSDRHISTTSALTDYTRLTLSTTSLDMETFIAKTEVMEPFPIVEEPEVIHTRAKSQGTMPSLPEFDETVDHQPVFRRDFTHGSDPNLVNLAQDGGRSLLKRKEPMATRRRARTTSLSTPPPGQYALFPSVNITGSRI